MNTLNDYVAEYIEYCEYRKRLDRKTLKAYRIDLKQYADYLHNISEFYFKDSLDKYITHLHKQYKPKTVKRKIASLKAFFHYMEYKEILSENPFTKLDIRYIQRMLRHSSISTTEIYTHVSNVKQKDILLNKHPRNLMDIDKG